MKGNGIQMFDFYDKNHKLNLDSIFYNQVNSVEEFWFLINNYLKTWAYWGYIGSCVGMGDRHGSNILFTSKMKAIHIDFQYSLDYGMSLGVPQTVPFRLTKSVISPMGLLRQYGLFYAYFVQGARIMNKERDDQLWYALSYFNSREKEDDKKIMKRITFRNFDGNPGIQEGSLKWIRLASDQTLLRYMYGGWKAF